MSADSVVSIVWDVLKMVVVPIKRQFGYVISPKSFADGLKKEVRNLEDKAERLHIAAEVARNNLRNFYREFTEWEASAEEALKEAGILLDDFEKATKTCCYGTLPDPYWRYQFSRKAKGKIEVIKQLTQKCSEFKESNISFTEPTPGNVTVPTPARIEGKDVVQPNISTVSMSSASLSINFRDDDIFESRAQIIRDIKEALAENSNSVVGVHGMGGLGKSTLLEEVRRIISKEKSFDWVAKADVSKNPDIKRIQGEIADALGLTDIQSKESLTGRAELLHSRLKKEEREKKKVLIILDNLWKELDLKSVGIPCRHDNKVTGCKLLLTSRDQKVLQDMHSDEDFRLLGLRETEAKRLFEGTVGDKVHEDEFKPWVEVALHKCAGVPFLIVAMAKRLKNAALYEWKDTLKNIKKFQDKEINDLIDQMLQWSYDQLKEEVKSLLRLCVVYHISKPSLENLVRFCVGLRLFQEIDSMEDARNRLRSHICTLRASSLLLDSEDVDGFKIHDLVCEFVTSVSSRDHPLLMLKDKVKSVTELLKDKPNDYRAMCFPFVDMEELPQELDCPELQVFLLFTNNKSLHVPDSLFYSMKKVMVLNLTGIRLTCSPSPFQLLKNLYTLCLDNCSIDNVSILGELKGLQVLSCVNSNLQQLPKEIGQLTELRLLDLNHCSHLQIIEPGVLERLIKLEDLFLENSFEQWNAMEQTQPTNASLIELNHMKSLFTLHVSIPDPSMLPEDLDVEKLEKHKIQIGNAWRRWKHKGLRILDLKLDPKSDVLRKGCIQSILSKIDDLFLDKLNEIEQSICALSQEGFPKLKHLLVQDSPSILYILRWHSLGAFEMLESLLLINLINLEKICYSHISSSKSFGKLKVIQVESCDKMEVLFPLSLLRGLPQLEEIKLVDCKLMHSIVEADDCGKVELHNLHVLELHGLPNIKNFFIAGTTPSISTLDDQVGTQIAFFNGQQDSRYIQHLQTLDVSHCDELSKMFTPTIAENLVALTKLRISNCRILTEVINDEKGGDGRVVAFNQLKYMELDGLIGLRSFSSGGYTLMFPLLEDIIVTRCPNMKFFSQGSTEASKLKRVQVSKEAWFWAGNLNITIQNMFEEMGTFAGVEKMLLSEFPRLIGKWHNELNPIKSYWQLKSVVVDKCPSFINAIPSRLMLVLDNLHYLQVCDCELLEEIFDLEGLEAVESTRVLPQLWELNLVNLPKLRRLWNRDLQESLCFNSLESLILYNCSNLGYAFSPSMAQYLANLELMEIKECGQMEGVIVEEEAEGSAMKKITFPKLQRMTMEYLPNLTCFLLGKNHMLECPKLEMMIIAHCPKMESLIGQSQMEDDHRTPSFFTSQVQCPALEQMDLSHMDNLSKIWSDNPQETPTFDNLWKMQVQNCRSLENVFSHWVATSLTQIKELRVESCGIEEIVASGNETPHSNTTQDLFPKLTSLVLHDMPQLKNLCANLPALNWPFLKELRVTHCDKANMLYFVASMSNWAKKDYQQGLSDQEAHSLFERDFPNLERLLLVDNNIQMIQDGNFPDDIFGKPKALTLACFHDENAVFPLKFLLERFQNLQSLEVFCSSFEDIFLDEGLVDNGKHPVLESLEELKLNKLHNLKSIWREGSLMLKFLQSIKTFEVWDCPCLTTIFPTVTSFKNLMTLVCIIDSIYRWISPPPSLNSRKQSRALLLHLDTIGVKRSVGNARAEGSEAAALSGAEPSRREREREREGDSTRWSVIVVAVAGEKIVLSLSPPPLNQANSTVPLAAFLAILLWSDPAKAGFLSGFPGIESAPGPQLPQIEAS